MVGGGGGRERERAALPASCSRLLLGKSQNLVEALFSFPYHQLPLGRKVWVCKMVAGKVEVQVNSRTVG